MLFVGIDPGIKGAIAIVNSEGELLACKIFPSVKEVSQKGRNMSRQDMTKLDALFRNLARHRSKIKVIMIEKPLLLPGQNVASTFNGGVSHGVLKAFIEIYFPGIPVESVSCKDWQQEMITHRTFVESRIRRDRRKQLKLDSVEEAKRRFPGFNFNKSKRSKHASDGMTDAALIAYYCYQQFK